MKRSSSVSDIVKQTVSECTPRSRSRPIPVNRRFQPIVAPALYTQSCPSKPIIGSLAAPVVTVDTLPPLELPPTPTLNDGIETVSSLFTGYRTRGPSAALEFATSCPANFDVTSSMAAAKANSPRRRRLRVARSSVSSKESNNVSTEEIMDNRSRTSSETNSIQGISTATSKLTVGLPPRSPLRSTIPIENQTKRIKTPETALDILKSSASGSFESRPPLWERRDGTLNSSFDEQGGLGFDDRFHHSSQRFRIPRRVRGVSSGSFCSTYTSGDDIGGSFENDEDLLQDEMFTLEESGV
eukprot:g6182.t1